MDLRYLGSFDWVWTYSRVSSREQSDKRKSLEGQQERLREILPKPDLHFCDVQGGDERQRPDYQRLRSMVKEEALKGKRVLVVVTELDRVGRDNEEINDLVEEFDLLGVTLFALSGGRYTAAESHDWLRTNQEGLYAEYYLRKLRERLRQTKKQRRSDAKPLATRAPFGYKWTREKLIPHPEHWAIARKLIDRFITDEHAGTRELVRMLQEYDIKMTRSGIRDWLLKPALRGHLQFVVGGDSREARKKRKAARDAAIKAGKTPPKNQKIYDMHYDTHEPLITEAEFVAIQKKLEENRRYYGRNKEAARHPLSGLVICGSCGYKMSRYRSPNKQGRIYPAYRCQIQSCPKRMGALESKIEEAVWDALSDRQTATRIAEMVVEPSDRVKSDQEVEKENQLQELLNTYEKLKLESLLPIIAQTQKDLAAIRGIERHSNAMESEVWELVEMLVNSGDWRMMSSTEKRKLYHDLVESIIIRSSQEFEINLQV